DGRPVVAAAVVAQGDNLAAPTLAVSDAHGRFELASVGQVALQARHPGYTPSAAFVVPGSGARHEIELRLARAGCRLAGRAFDVAGAPLAGASVAVVAVMNKTYALGAAATQQRPLLLRADADGAFATDEVAAGEYLVLARARDPEITPVWAKVDTTAGEAFVELRCEHPTVIEGVVRGLDETTAKEVRITVFPNESNQELGSLLNLVGMRTTGVGPDGAFRIVGAMPGEQTVQAYRGMAPIGRREVEVAAGDTVRCEFSLSADEALAIELVMPPGVALSPGRVFAYVYDLAQDSSANQVPGIVVFTGGAGRLENPPAGEAQIMVIVLLGEAGGHAQIAKQHIGAGEREVRIEIDAAALPSRTIRGRLVDDRRAPVANEAVVADRTDGNGLFAHVQGRTLADGRFEIGPLPAGSYSLAVLRGDHGEPIGSAVVTAAGDEDVGDLTFPPR
ncbi:MAG: carboxypeptidase regulatory-like domain-containing protein, partial [Planctomycetes bacterium]|nr:carboxypeptidase regulatory-like domain-containing protein [Planctomycetota bacterium]